jgi:Fe-S cluster assembly iron-binding protein IscA
MALDEPKENDSIHEIGGYQFIVDKVFLEKAKPVKVDFTNYGFAISSSIELGKGGCGGGCGGGDSGKSSCCG